MYGLTEFSIRMMSILRICACSYISMFVFHGYHNNSNSSRHKFKTTIATIFINHKVVLYSYYFFSIYVVTLTLKPNVNTILRANIFIPNS